MKLNLLPISIISLSIVAPFLPSFTPPSLAACVMVDVATQIAIRGSHDPSSQSNDVAMAADPQCFGSYTVDTGSQIYDGSGSADQSRDASHYVGGTTTPGVTGPIIGVPVYVPVDVYSPANDPDFMGSFGGVPVSGGFGF